jgi:hypothetical protein
MSVKKTSLAAEMAGKTEAYTKVAISDRGVQYASKIFCG